MRKERERVRLEQPQGASKSSGKSASDGLSPPIPKAVEAAAASIASKLRRPAALSAAASLPQPPATVRRAVVELHI